MSLKIKIIYSLYPSLSLLFTLVNFFYDDVVDYELLDNIFLFLWGGAIFFYFFFIRWIWKKTFSKEKKILVTVLSVMFLPLTLFYIWGVKDENK